MPETEIENIKEHPRVKEMPSVRPDQERLQQSVTETSQRFGFTPGGTQPPIAEREPPRLTPAGAEPPSELAVQVETLKKLLAAEELATLRATRAASDFRDQLTEAQADLAGMKSKWYASEKSRKAAGSHREVDASSITTQLHRIQKELERERAAHKADLDQSVVKQKSLERKLEDVESAAGTAQTANARKGRLRTQAAAAVAVLAIGGCAAMAFRQMRGAPDHEVKASTEAAPRSAATLTSAAYLSSTKMRAQGASRTRREPSKPFVPRGVTTDLPKALDRLSQALAQFPGEEPKAVLHEVFVRQSRADFPVCSFDWANGEPSMVFGKSENRNANMTDWAVKISRCADAIEQAR